MFGGLISSVLISIKAIFYNNDLDDEEKKSKVNGVTPPSSPFLKGLNISKS